MILACAPQSKAQSDGRPLSLSNALDSSLDALVNPLKINVNLVLVPVVVTDTLNHPITGLGKQSFALSEDGEQQEIEYFSTEDSPISVGLLLDLSKSMTDKFDAERTAVSEFFKNANSQDDYFVVSFSNHPEILTEPTQSIGTIQAKLAGDNSKREHGNAGRNLSSHGPYALRQV